MLQPKLGRPWSYDKKIHHQDIIEALPGVMTLNMTARMARIPPATFKEWIKQGDEDYRNHLGTDLAQLSADVRKLQAIEAKKLLDVMKEMPKGWQAMAWLLERCFREDFGQDNEVIAELKATFEELKLKFAHLGK